MTARPKALARKSSYSEIVQEDIRPSTVPASASPEPPQEFTDALLTFRKALIDASLGIKEIRAPQGLAPWSAAVELTAAEGNPEGIRAVLIVLYDPKQEELWGGPLRLVGRGIFPLEDEQAADPLLGTVVWQTLTEELEHSSSSLPVGTVTVETTESFGGLHLTGATATAEMRCSWTPLTFDLAPQLQAWSQVILKNSGLLPKGSRWAGGENG